MSGGKISKKFNWLLILSVSASVLVSSIATTSYLVYVSEKSAHDKNIIHAQGLANYIHEYLNTAYILGYQLSVNPLITQQLRSASPDWETRLREYEAAYDTTSKLGPGSGPGFLVRMHQEYDFVDLIFIQDANGDQTGRSYGLIGHRKDRWWYREFVEQRQLHPFISKSYYSLTGNKPVASVFHAVVDDGEFIGIVGIDIEFAALQEKVETYLNVKDMYAIITDTRGVIIAHPDRAVIRRIFNLVDRTKQILKRDSAGKVLMDERGNQITETVPLDWATGMSDAVSAALRGESGYIKNVKVQGTTSTLYYEPVPLPSDGAIQENYAVLLVQANTTIVHARRAILLATALLILVAATLLYVLFHARFRKFILEPLQILIDAMKHADIDHFQTIELHTDDEFDLMAHTYNDLRINLARAHRQLLEKIEILKEREEGYRILSEIGLALTTETESEPLLELILTEAMRFTRADGGTLYLYDEQNRQLQFRILRNETMGLRYGGASDERVVFPPVPLYVDGKPNYSNVSSYSALTAEVVNIPDVYEAEGFDFQGTRKYDEINGYRSMSMLVVPLRNRDKQLLGVLQLINARARDGSGRVVPFSTVYQDLTATFAYQAAIKITQVRLNMQLQELLHSIIQSIAAAIDAKSPFTGKHVSRVAGLCEMIAQEINHSTGGAFRDVHFSNDEMEELRYAAWMHDIGKIATPESILNKETKLQLISDQIETVRTRFELIRRQMENEALQEKLTLCSPDSAAENRERVALIEAELEQRTQQLQQDLEFVAFCNDPRALMDEQKLQRLRAIAARTVATSTGAVHYLSERELENLSVRSGTLTAAERRIIEEHARMTETILQGISFPPHLEGVVPYASMHHERPNGTGYYRGLSGREIPLQARIIAIADIIEALTAPERPYRDPLDYRQAVEVLNEMKERGEVDPDIVSLIVESGIYERFQHSSGSSPDDSAT